MKKKIIIGIIIVCVIGGIVFALTMSSDNNTTNYKYETVTEKNFISDITSTGFVESSEKNVISSSLPSGIVANVYVKAGQYVEEGTVILDFEMDDTLEKQADIYKQIDDYKETLQNAYDTALANKDAAWGAVYAPGGSHDIYLNAEQAFNSAASSIQYQINNYNNAYNIDQNAAIEMNNNFATYNNLLATLPSDTTDPNYAAIKLQVDTAKVNYDTSVANYNLKHAELDLATEALKLAKTQVNYDALEANLAAAKLTFDTQNTTYTNAEALLATALENLNKKDDPSLELLYEQLETLSEEIKNNQVLATSSGTITTLNAEVGAFMSQGTTIGTIENTKSLIVNITVSEANYPLIRLNQKAIINSEEENETTAYISNIAPIATTSSSNQGQVFEVELTIDKVTDNLIIGMNVDASIILEETLNALVVPYHSIVNEGEQAYVYKVINDDFVKTPVELGLNDGYYYVIESSDIQVNDIIMGYADTMAAGLENE